MGGSIVKETQAPISLSIIMQAVCLGATLCDIFHSKHVVHSSSYLFAMGAWESQAERAANLAADRLNLIWVMPAQGRTRIMQAASLAIFEQVVDIAGT
jgi:hypothetical protein